MSLAIEIASCAVCTTGIVVMPLCFWNWNLIGGAGLLSLRRSGVVILLSTPRFCGSIFCDAELSSLIGSGELGRKIGVGVGVLGVLGVS